MESLDATVVLFCIAFVFIVVACDALERLYFKKNPHDRFKD